ncbi:unnamed protein product [Urochloa humidicola]
MAEDAAAAKRRRRCMGEAGGGDMSALPEHLLQQVLSRVGTVKDLLRFAATCRRWLGRFTDRTFLREIVCPGQAQGQGLLLGFFLQNACRGASMGTRADAAQQLASACFFLPAPGSPPAWPHGSCPHLLLGRRRPRCLGLRGAPGGAPWHRPHAARPPQPRQPNPLWRLQPRHGRTPPPQTFEQEPF